MKEELIIAKEIAKSLVEEFLNDVIIEVYD